jgi:hypothetical protein
MLLSPSHIISLFPFCGERIFVLKKFLVISATICASNVESVPNSGTSFTLMNTQEVTQMTTASNYASEVEELVPPSPNLASTGPYLLTPSLPVPEFVLTKTHCAGYGARDIPSSYALRTVNDFERGCLTVQSSRPTEAASSPSSPPTMEMVFTSYNISVPVKAIHLVRNPFNNLVARWHLGRKKVPMETFDEWCTYLDGRHQKEEDELFKPYKFIIPDGLKCRGEWYRYVQWHNMAFEVTNRNRLPVEYVRFESYEDEYDGTVSRILRFLNFSLADMVKPPLEFTTGKSYLVLYSDSQKRAAKSFVQAMASNETWSLLECYFEGI